MTSLGLISLTCLAVGSLPPVPAHLVSLLVAAVVAEAVVAGPAEFGARVVEVVGRAEHPVPVRDAGGPAPVPLQLPLRPGDLHPGEHVPLDHPLPCCCKEKERE